MIYYIKFTVLLDFKDPKIQISLSLLTLSPSHATSLNIYFSPKTRGKKPKTKTKTKNKNQFFFLFSFPPSIRRFDSCGSSFLLALTWFSSSRALVGGELDFYRGEIAGGCWFQSVFFSRELLERLDLSISHSHYLSFRTFQMVLWGIVCGWVVGVSKSRWFSEVECVDVGNFRSSNSGGFKQFSSSGVFFLEKWFSKVEFWFSGVFWLFFFFSSSANLGLLECV